MRFNITSYDDLPTRAKNIVDSLGGMDKALEYFKVNQSFLKISNTGNKTNLELISLCEYLIFEEQISNPIEQIKEQEPAIPFNIQDLIDCYCIKKLSTTIRLRNYLDRIEDQAQFNTNLKNQTKFILYYFICDFNFMNAKNLGGKTVYEIEIIRDEIRKRANYQVDISESDTKIEEELSKIIFRNLSYSLPIEKIKETITNSGKSYNLPILLKVFLLAQKFPQKVKDAFELFYFTSKKLDNQTVAEALNFTKERARQLKIKFKKGTIPDAINTILSSLDGIPYSLENQFEYFIELFEDSSNEYEFFYNIEFLKIIYTHLNTKTYYDLEELISDTKSFMLPSNTILISAEFVEKVSLIDLLSFIDNEIYNFEVVEFEYDRKILIQRFYDENDILIDLLDLNRINHFIDKIIRTDWTDIEDVIRRGKKRKEKEEIYNLVHGFIQGKNEPQRTQALVDYLSSCYIEISKVYLLHILNKNNARFQRVGNGYWTITELEKNVHGSLREIIEQKLFESEKPLHFSEIHEYVNSLRPITEHSLRVNLKVEEDKIFTFFNCSFIGLSSKVYDSYWYNLPKAIASVIRSIYTSPLKFNTEEDKISYFSNLFKYPPIHLRYLLSMRKNVANE